MKFYKYHLSLVLLLCVALAMPALSEAPKPHVPVLSGFFAGLSTDSGVFIATSAQDLSGSYLIRLKGIDIPPKAQSQFSNYCAKFLGGNLLHCFLEDRLEAANLMQSYRGSIMIVQGNKYINFNKQIVKDGYAVLTSSAPADWQQFQTYARNKGLGVWSTGAPKWTQPALVEPPPEGGTAVTDRDKMMNKYGLPDHSTRTLIPDNYSILQYHLYITDIYIRSGLVFIYRDGKLVNKMPTAR